MSQLRAQISLSSTSVSNENFRFDNSKLVFTKNPAIQTKACTVETGADTAIVDPAAGEAAYVFVYNSDTSNYIKVKFDDGAGNALYAMRIGPRESTWITVDSTIACSLKADTAPCKVEFGYFTLNKY
tara:strand:- start:147 stop:527 length:381 start_codon:yes stop_codon:yes gene_type:complete